jgi:hypothetical protein
MTKMRSALCAIAKNEGPYVREWIAYHLALGFDKIVIFDNDSTDGDLSVYSSARPGRVEVRHWPTQWGKAPQVPAYNKFLNEDGHLYDWIAFLDLDEFLNLKKHDSISAFLEAYNDYSAIAINWRMFGSSGLTENDGRLVTDRFDQASPVGFGPNAHVKTIFRPQCAESADVHSPHLKNGSNLVNTNKLILKSEANGLQLDIVLDTAQINHYFTKSYEEFRKKRMRGRADVAIGEDDKYRTEKDFKDYDINSEVDRSIHRFRESMLREYARLSAAPAPFRALDFLRRKLGLSGLGAKKQGRP